MNVPWISLMAAMRKGVMLADPATWKNRQVLINAIGGLVVILYSIARALGWMTWEIDDATLQDLGLALGGALFSLANVVLTVGTTTKIGLEAPGQVPAAADVVVRDAAGGLRLPDGSTAHGSVPTDADRIHPSTDRPGANPFLDN